MTTKPTAAKSLDDTGRIVLPRKVPIAAASALVIAVITAWTLLGSRVAGVERKVDEHLGESKPLVAAFHELKADVAAMRVELRGHGDLLKEVRDDVKGLRR